MSDKIEQIKETLTNPQAITEFEYDPDVRFYFRYYKKRKEYLFVSVKYVKNHPSEMGGMISSHFQVVFDARNSTIDGWFSSTTHSTN